ncbi:MAG: hypothetical protein V1685_03265 [Parcubacteria group bacterium]
MPRGSRQQDTFAMFVANKFEPPPEPPELDEKGAEEVFGEHSAVGLIDMLVAAKDAGGFTRAIILEYAPAGLRGDGEEAKPEAFNRIWMLLVFFTKRYEWNPLPGMSGYGSGKKQRRAGTSTGEPTTIIGKLTRYLEGHGGLKRGFKALIREHGTVVDVAAFLTKKLKVQVGTQYLYTFMSKNGISVRQ